MMAFRDKGEQTHDSDAVGYSAARVRDKGKVQRLLRQVCFGNRKGNLANHEINISHSKGSL
jgi:hypothetical protein